MKIAIASENNLVSGHFGHCEGFKIYHVENGQVTNEDFIENPGHKPGFLPVFLSEKNINVIISGGMGETAQNLFKENNIDVIVGACGSCNDIIKSFISGSLKSTGSVCTEHQHEGNCTE